MARLVRTCPRADVDHRVRIAECLKYGFSDARIGLTNVGVTSTESVIKRSHRRSFPRPNAKRKIVYIVNARRRFLSLTATLVTRRLGCALVAAVVLPGFALAQSTFTHVHMRVADTAVAASWYRNLLGGEVTRGGPGPSIRQVNGFIGTMPNEGIAGASRGGAIDHFGFSVEDVVATVERARRMGARIDAEPRTGITAPVIAFIEDPWGTRVELMEDPEYPGINHVHLMVNGADEVRDWFLEVFGGEFVPDRGGENFHCILYEDLWVQITEVPEGERAPSRGRSLDHMGFRIPEALPDFAARIEATGYPPYLIRPNPPGSDLLFFEGPGGIHFEVVQRTDL